MDFLSRCIPEKPTRTVELPCGTITMRRLGGVDRMRCGELGRQLVEHFSEMPFPPIGGQIVEDIPAELFHTAAALSVMHVPAEGEDRIPPVQFVAMAFTMEEAFDALTVEANALNLSGKATAAAPTSQESPSGTAAITSTERSS